MPTGCQPLKEIGHARAHGTKLIKTQRGKKAATWLRPTLSGGGSNSYRRQSQLSVVAGPRNQFPTISRLPALRSRCQLPAAGEERGVKAKVGGLHGGTSGWTYKDWRGRFYPKDVAQKDWLPWYAQQFNATEINGSFYRTPT